MRITGDEDVVRDTIVVKVGECTVAVGLVAIPRIVVKWINVTVSD